MENNIPPEILAKIKDIYNTDHPIGTLAIDLLETIVNKVNDMRVDDVWKLLSMLKAQ